MSGNLYAVLIGIDEYSDKQHLPPLRYAEKDCRDLHRVLTDPATCNFPTNNVKILLGSEATMQNVEEALYTYICKDRTPEDIVLVYFSGHGFIAGDRQLAYLGTYDVQIKNLLQNPNAGLRMDRIYDDIFLTSPAKHLLFILDCCHSGAITPSSTRGMSDSETAGLIDSKFFETGMGRIALVACPPDAPSRESGQLQNGIFTHYIIRALKGEAADPETGEVTLDSLISFVHDHTPPDQPPGIYGHWYGRIVLSRTVVVKKPKPLHLEPQPALAQALESKPLANPLDPYLPFVRNLVALLANDQSLSGTAVDRHVLDAIRKASEAEFAFVLRHENEKWGIKSRSEIAGGNGNETEYIEQAASRAISAISGKAKDVYYAYQEKEGSSKAFVAVPVYLGQVNEFIIVSGIRPDSFLLGDIYTRILARVYLATREMTSISSEIIEAAIYDGTRQSRGYVPSAVYNRRYELFRQRLEQMDVFFEPILNLDPRNLYVCGWEALARDPVSQAAPIDLFAAAELWGHEFTTHLDMHFLRTAMLKYREALKRARMTRAGEIQDLSINVYPATLMKPEYFQAVDEVLKESALLPQKIILEVSEKASIPEEANGIEGFKRRLEKYVRELRIGFGIDDFGVGYASVSHLVSLNPSYVKIDRDALQHEYSDFTFRFVLDVVSHQRLNPPKVIVEGFDSSSKVSLDHIYDVGIRYVQGYIVGRAGPELYRLDKEVVQYLEGLINRRNP